MYSMNLRQEPSFNGGIAQRYEQPGFDLRNNDRYRHVSNSSVAHEFADNFNHFRRFGRDFVSRQDLELAANRPLTGEDYTDRMTLLAREILSRPEMSYLLDAGSHDGMKDGLISRDHVDATIKHFDAQETLPLREVAKHYYGGLQRQRFDGQYANESQAKYPAQTSGQRPYANDSKEELCNKILVRFSCFEDPNAPGLITDKSLNAIASGYRLDGQPATQVERDLANEVLERGGLFKRLDQGRSGELNGAFSRQDLADATDENQPMSDKELITRLQASFRQYTKTQSSDLVSFDDLEEAAGLKPSNRHFSEDARVLAREILNRPELLQRLDVAGDRHKNPDGKFGLGDLTNLAADLSSAPRSSSRTRS